jgi:hypothetical protein
MPAISPHISCGTVDFTASRIHIVLSGAPLQNRAVTGCGGLLHREISGAVIPTRLDRAAVATPWLQSGHVCAQLW